MLRRPVSGICARTGVDRSTDQSVFRNTSDRTHYLNVSRRSMMRGGIRL